jgi:hypothetical protein
MSNSPASWMTHSPSLRLAATIKPVGTAYVVTLAPFRAPAANWPALCCTVAPSLRKVRSR